MQAIPFNEHKSMSTVGHNSGSPKIEPKKLENKNRFSASLFLKQKIAEVLIRSYQIGSGIIHGGHLSFFPEYFINKIAELQNFILFWY